MVQNGKNQVLYFHPFYYSVIHVLFYFTNISILDIQFFDESIEAKINRYTFRLHKRDTPFLLDSSQKHSKTFVARSVDVDNLVNIQYPNDETEEWIRTTQRITQDKKGKNVFHYQNFPKLK